MRYVTPRGMARLLVATALFSLGATAANAATYHGRITLQHVFSTDYRGSEPGVSGEAFDWLWFDDGQAIEFEMQNGRLYASGPQRLLLRGVRSGPVEFVIDALQLSLTGDNGRPYGTIDYRLDGVRGTFLFASHRFGDRVNNRIFRDEGALVARLWGGDSTNRLGIDLAFDAAVVPVPGAALLLGSGLLGLGLAGGRRRP